MEISDEKLLSLCERFGRRTLMWRRKFIGLLPEVNRRRLYEKKNCHSIFEFAAKLAGLSEEQVRLALRLDRRFEDKPSLKSLLTKGEVSLNKLERIASIATPENETDLAEKVRILPKSALETLVRDERYFQQENGFKEPIFGIKSTPGRALSFELSPELVDELNTLHAQGKDPNALMLELLEERKRKIEEKKQAMSNATPRNNSRYIPVQIRKLLKEEFGKKCSIKSCLLPATEIHHTQRFSLASTHDPNYLAPLCKAHHQIAHSIDQRYGELQRRHL